MTIKLFGQNDLRTLLEFKQSCRELEKTLPQTKMKSVDEAFAHLHAGIIPKRLIVDEPSAGMLSFVGVASNLKFMLEKFNQANGTSLRLEQLRDRAMATKIPRPQLIRQVTTMERPQGVAKLQPREAQFGAGTTQRVWELDLGGAHFGVNVGDISQAPTEAILCPMAPSLQLEWGAVENVLAKAYGEKKFEDVLEHLRSDLSKQGITEAGYGAATSVDAQGGLKDRGVKTLVLSSVLVPSGHDLSADDIALFVRNACLAAEDAGVVSLTVPAIGTGFMDAITREESLQGCALGYRWYLEEKGGAHKAKVKRLDFNNYSRQELTEQTAKDVGAVAEHLNLAATFTEAYENL